MVAVAVGVVVGVGVAVGVVVVVVVAVAVGVAVGVVVGVAVAVAVVVAVGVAVAVVVGVAVAVVRLVLPFPPSVNHYWVPARSRLVLSHAARRYRALVGCHVLEQKAAVKLSDRLSVTLELHMPDKRCRDLDNYCKGLLDALTHAGVWGDDEQIDELTIRRRPVIKGGQVVMHIEAL